MVKFHPTYWHFGICFVCEEGTESRADVESYGMCWLVFVFTPTTVDIFHWEKKNEIKMLFLLPSVFRDLKRTCPSCTGIHCTVQTILLLCVWFQTKFFLLIRPFPPFFCSTVALVLFAPVGEKDQWNVCWTTQQIHFLGPILFVYRFFFWTRTQQICWKIAMATD